MKRNEFYDNLKDYKASLSHYGIIGQKWGNRRWQNQDGTFNEEGKIRYFGEPKRKNPKGTVFISGSSKTQFSDNPYYRKELPQSIQEQILKYMNQGKTILVGDAPGIDRQVQDFLNKNDYKDVEVYSPGTEVRYTANPKWKTNLVDVPGTEKGSGEWLRGKDEAMTERADEGLAIVIEDGAVATRNNITRLESQNKKCNVFQLNPNGNDEWIQRGSFDGKTVEAIRDEGYDIDSSNNRHSNVFEYLENVSNNMYEDFSYDESDHKLQTPSQTFNKKTGNCHDQTLFEKELFEQMGLEPKTLFLIEVDPKTGQGGTTHSLVYLPNGNSVTYFENAWGDNAGVQTFTSVDRLKDWIKQEHEDGNLGDSNKYPRIVWGEFHGEPGDSLQEIVDKSLK